MEKGAGGSAYTEAGRAVTKRRASDAFSEQEELLVQPRPGGAVTDKRSGRTVSTTSATSKGPPRHRGKTAASPPSLPPSAETLAQRCVRLLRLFRALRSASPSLLEEPSPEEDDLLPRGHGAPRHRDQPSAARGQPREKVHVVVSSGVVLLVPACLRRSVRLGSRERAAGQLDRRSGGGVRLRSVPEDEPVSSQTRDVGSKVSRSTSWRRC